MTLTNEKIMGMDLEVCRNKFCYAEVGTGKDWATIYHIESEVKNEGYGTSLLKEMKAHYEGKGLRFGSSVALSPSMKHLLLKLEIKEYC